MSATIEEQITTVDPEDGVRAGAVDVNESKGLPKKKRLMARQWTGFMKLVRRIHLYSGIFMFPFVLLYGFTGWFFNHPRYFTGDEVRQFSANDVGSEELSALATPQIMAEQVVEELNIESFLVGGPEVKLTGERVPQFNNFLTYSVTAEGASHQISIDPISGSGEIRTTYDAPESVFAEPPSNPLESIPSAAIQDNALTQAQTLMPSLLKELELPSGEASAGRRAPSLVFSAEVDGVPTVVTYNLGNGSVSGLREDAKPPVEVKSFLQRLHLARTYSPHLNVKWFWALMVDLMFVSMVFWGMSGLLMWWQIKRTRILGAGFLVASLTCATLLAVGMHDQLSTSGRGRGGGGRGGHGPPQATSMQDANGQSTMTRSIVAKD